MKITLLVHSATPRRHSPQFSGIPKIAAALAMGLANITHGGATDQVDLTPPHAVVQQAEKSPSAETDTDTVAMTAQADEELVQAPPTSAVEPSEQITANSALNSIVILVFGALAGILGVKYFSEKITKLQQAVNRLIRNLENGSRESEPKSGSDTTD